MTKDMWQELNMLINDDEYSKRSKHNAYFGQNRAVQNKVYILIIIEYHYNRFKQILSNKYRPKNPNKPIEAIYPTFVDNQISIIRSTIDSNDDDVTLIGDNKKDCVKRYTIRSDSKVNIEVCKYELRNMIKTEVICNHCFDISNDDLIEQEICSNYLVRYEWDFEKLEITVIISYLSIIKCFIN